MFLISSFRKQGKYFLWLLVLCMIVPMIYACGSSDDGAVLPHSVSGNASKGPIYPGTVTAYKIVGGQKDGVLGTAETDPNGEYTITFIGYTGPVILEVSGKYLDEATGDPNKQIDPNKPLHAMLSSTTGTIKAAITPLTEIAYKRAAEIGRDQTDPNLIVFDPNIIEQANSEVSTILGVDILRTLPVNVKDKNALEADPNDSERKAQIKYGLYLAAISIMADSNSIDAMDMVDILADEIKDGKVGEAGEITLNDIGNILIEVTDPNNNILDPNISTLSVIQDIAQDQSDFYQYYDPNDPNGVIMVGSPTAGESPLEQAQAMIQELRTMLINTETTLGAEDTRLVTEIESSVAPELEELGEMVWILGYGMRMIFDDPNKFLDPNNLLQDLVNKIPLQTNTDVDTNDTSYTVTLELDFSTGVMLTALLDPNIQSQLQDPNYWYTFIDPNFLDEFLDPNEQAELQDPNLFAIFDPNEMGLDPNVLSEFEDPNIDILCFEADYTIEEGIINKGTGSLVFSLDRCNGGIKLLTLNGTLGLTSGTATLTDCSISFREDPTDPNKTRMLIQFIDLQTPLITAASNLEIQMQGGPFGEDIIGEGDLLALNLLSLKGSFEILNSTQWNGEISFSEPVLVDPNFLYSPLALPSKLELMGAYTVPNSIYFDGNITAKFHNVNELYSYHELDGNQVDPNVEIKVTGELSMTDDSEELLLQMTLKTAQADVYNISNLTFTYNGKSIMGDISISDIEGAESVILDLQNQDGIEVDLEMDGILDGTIIKDGILLGVFDEIDGLPRVKFSDGYFETLF